MFARGMRNDWQLSYGQLPHPDPLPEGEGEFARGWRSKGSGFNVPVRFPLFFL
jgi:hypothetical protein